MIRPSPQTIADATIHGLIISRRGFHSWFRILVHLRIDCVTAPIVLEEITFMYFFFVFGREKRK